MRQGGGGAGVGAPLRNIHLGGELRGTACAVHMNPSVGSGRSIRHTAMVVRVLLDGDDFQDLPRIYLITACTGGPLVYVAC